MQLMLKLKSAQQSKERAVLSSVSHCTSRLSLKTANYLFKKSMRTVIEIDLSNINERITKRWRVLFVLYEWSRAKNVSLIIEGA